MALKGNSEIIVITVIAVMPVYNDNPRDPKFVAVVDRWSLLRGYFMLCYFMLCYVYVMKIEIVTPK